MQKQVNKVSYQSLFHNNNFYEKKMYQVGRTPNHMHFFLQTDGGTSKLHWRQTYIQCRFKVPPN
jgi:hypothetical protein